MSFDHLGRIAERGDNDDPRGYPDPRHELSLIERYVSLTDRDVLEIGSGNGRLTLEYARRARRVVAVEPDRRSVADARARARAAGIARSIQFLNRPAQSELRGGPFDLVLFSWSLC